MVNFNVSKDMLSELAFNEKDLEELREARSMPVVFDEDCPETTPEKALKFKRVNPRRQAEEYKRAMKFFVVIGSEN